MNNLYIIDLPENLGVNAEIERIGVTRAGCASQAVRNYLFANLPGRSARIAASRIAGNGGYAARAHLVPEFEGGSPEERRKARPYVFAAELAGGETPDMATIKRARWLLKRAGFACS